MHAEREGSFGRLRAEDATSLAMIISELVHNAVEHGLAAGGGTVQVQAERSVEDGEERLQVCVADDGQGLPEGFNPGRGGRAASARRSSPRWCRTCAAGSPGNRGSRAEPWCGSSRGFGRSRMGDRQGRSAVGVVR